jgi:uracil phosphoribosyltransferase
MVTSPTPPSFTVINHPLIQHKLSILRDRATPTKLFKELVDEIAMLMAFEATRHLPLEPVTIETPLESHVAQRLSSYEPVLVPILRAGLGMVDGIRALMPSARVGHIGLYRDHETLEPVEYYFKVPSDIAQRDVFVLDPMLATGGSASEAVRQLKDAGAVNLTLVALLAAPEGLERLHADHPDLHIVVGAVDRQLNEKGYILPGLGDAGDRLFGTA